MPQENFKSVRSYSAYPKVRQYLGDMGFSLDCAPPPTPATGRQYFDEKLPNRGMGSVGPTSEPPPSLVLKAGDYFP